MVSGENLGLSVHVADIWSRTPDNLPYLGCPLLMLRRSDEVKTAAILGVLFLSSYAYFYQGGGWNQNTRFDLVRAMVERHTVQIDAYQDNTGDKAQVGEHFYADKAPGASLTAVPAVAAVRGVMRTLGLDVFAPAT